MPPSTSISSGGGTVRNTNGKDAWREFVASGMFYREQISENVDCSVNSETAPMSVLGCDELAVSLKRTDGGAWATADVDIYASIDGTDYFALATSLTGDAIANGIDVRGLSWVRAKVTTTHSIAATIALQAVGNIG